ncbi:MAG TPA: PAS domain S-box protein [Candidatus Limnocylindrales bacterium]|nr:PAS domain S-box protein [Candidatus Limnocylindrales bacterium]
MPGQPAWSAIERSVLNAAPNAIVAIDDTGRICYVNPQAELTFGYAAAAMLGQPIELLVAERATTRHVGHRDAFFRHPVARPMGIGLDLAGRRQDGTEFPVEISLSPVQTPTGLQVFATGVDITARKAAEAAHAESERRFRTVLEASPNPIVAVGDDGQISYANPQASRAFGYTVGELIGAPLWTLLPERVRERHVGHRGRYVEHPIARPMGIGMDLTGLRKDGTEFPVEISLSPVDTADGLQVFATVVDITARKAAESQLLQAQKLESIGRLAGGVAHDFNNILFAIRGYAELLIEDLTKSAAGEAPELRRMVEAIEQAAERGANLTSQLLAFSRKQMVSPEVVDPAGRVHALEPMLRRLIGENVRLAVRTPEDAGHIRVDPGHLDQIVMNLVVNARDAMPSGGVVAIEVGRTIFEEAYALEHFEVAPGSYVMLAVSDTGVGMDRETREHIFEPFFTTKEQGRGTGLGLATIYGIVRQAGGHIWLYSEPGRGSTFKLYFPDIDEPATPAPASKPGAVRATSGSLLLVEDEPSVRDMTRIMLERAGYQVTSVADGAAATTAVRTAATPFDVLVTDVVMPGMSGIELADLVARERPGTALVLLSGYTAETLDLDRLLAAGARFVTKPVSSSEMLRAIAEAREDSSSMVEE